MTLIAQNRSAAALLGQCSAVFAGFALLALAMLTAI
jgi:hypothetical protein